jgi:transmembrane sensor
MSLLIMQGIEAGANMGQQRRGAGEGRMQDDVTTDLGGLHREAHDWVAHFALGKAIPADLHRLKRWCRLSQAHADAFAKAARLWDRVGKTAAARRVGDTLVDFPGIGASNPSPIPLSSGRAGLPRRAVLGGALAAAAAGVASLSLRPPLELWPTIPELLADYRTTTGERRLLVLADEVSIEMNTRTSMSKSGRLGGVRGLELLSGEASVTAGPSNASPVGVLAADGRILATRGKFNVRCEGGAATVSCLSGETRIEYAASVVTLPAGRQVHYADGKMGVPTAVDPESVSSWQDGFLVFHAMPLYQAIDEINRYRPGKIILMNTELRSRIFSARFRISNVSSAVSRIQQVFDANVTTLPGGIVILS